MSSLINAFTDEVKQNKEKLKKDKDKLKEDILYSMWKVREDGCLIKIRYGKVLICGANGAGKTNFLNLLMNKKFNSAHISTQVAKPQQVTIAKAKVSVSDKEVGFKLMDIDNEIAHLMSYLPERYKTTPSQHSHHEISDNKGDDESEDKRSRCATITENIISGQAASNNAVMQPHNEIWDILTFIDTGGQPQFINLLPVINCFTMITFIVHKITKGGKKSLDNQFMVNHGNEKGKNSFKPYEHACTHLQLIKTLMSHASIQVLPDKKFLSDFKFQGTEACNPETADQKPNRSISFIGTHSTGIPRCEITEIDEVLMNMIKHSKSTCVKPRLNEYNNCLIPVDNKTQSEWIGTSTTEKPYKYTDVSKIRDYIYEWLEKQDVYNVPIQWLLLELEIRKICINRPCNFIAYSEVLKLAEEKHLGDENFIKNGLRFHHLFGVLLYFEEVEGMCELVIVNHQWLFEKLTKIVVCSFKCDNNLDDENLHNGIFEESMLKELRIKEDFEKSGITNESINPTSSFIKLLQHLRIAAPLRGKYFMPSLLNTCDLDNIQKSIPGKNSFKTLSTDPEPLLIQFESTDEINSFPRGYFCLLVVQLIHSPDWTLRQDNVYQNFMTFCGENDGYYLTLVDRIFFLEVHVTCVGSNKRPIHHEVLKTVNKALLAIGENLDISMQLRHGFLCRQCQTKEVHMTYIPKPIENAFVTHMSKKDVYCKCVGHILTQLESHHGVWLSPFSEV